MAVQDKIIAGTLLVHSALDRSETVRARRLLHEMDLDATGIDSAGGGALLDDAGEPGGGYRGGLGDGRRPHQVASLLE